MNQPDGVAMAKEEKQPGEGRVRTALIGVAALAGWMALLWFMFGDVL